MKMRWVRGVLYAVVIPLVVFVPRSFPNETACPYSILLVPKYIGEEIGIIKRKNQPVVLYGGVCSTYIGLPLVYISDIYDVKPARVSILLLVLNILIIVALFEALIFLGFKIAKSKYIKNNKAI